jgi:hypothetical protein
MPEIGTYGLMSGDGKQGDAGWPKPLRPSSTLLPSRSHCDIIGIWRVVEELDACERVF